MMMFEQLQAMNEKLARLGVGDSSGSTNPGEKVKLPSQTTNPHAEVKSIQVLRSATGPSVPVETVQQAAKSGVRQQTCGPQEIPCDPQAEETDAGQKSDLSKQPVPRAEKSKESGKPAVTLSPYRPPVPFSQRLAKSLLDEQFAKFVEVLKQLTISIPFTDALLQMPSYFKFLKDILSNKRSLKDCKHVQLDFECSAVVSRDVPPKLDDSGKFTIPCTIGKATIKKALCNLGASVSLMPHSVFKRMGVGELKPTRLTLQLVDNFVRL